MNVPDLVERFLRHWQRSGSRPNTLRQYRIRLKQLVAYFGDVAWSDIDREELLDYLHSVNHWPADHPTQPGEPKSNATIRANVTALQLLESYLAEFHQVEPKLTARDRKKPPIAKRDTLPTEEQVRRILEVARDDWSLIYRALRLTGARPGELVAAMIEDLIPRPTSIDSAGQLDPRPNTLQIVDHKTARKTGKPRSIPVGDLLLPLITRSICVPAFRASGRVFVDNRGQPWTVPRISRLFRQYRRRLDLPEAIVLYCTRHEFGSAVTKKFGIFQAKELLGHTDIKTTDRYSHMTQDELREIQENAIRDVA